MGIVYLKGIKKGDRIFYQEENNSINDRIEDLSKKKIRVLVQGYGTVEGGTAEGTRYKEGEKVTLIAKTQTKTINEVEYTSEFKGWYLDGKLQSTDTNYVIEVTKDATYTAIFDMEPTLIYYLDSNSEEQILVTKEATINSTTYTDAGIDKTQITKVVFGNSCTSIGTSAFEKCTSLNYIKAENTNQIVILGRAFALCSNLESVKATNIKLEKFGHFNGCTKLKNLELGSKGHLVNSTSSSILYNSGGNDLIIRIYMLKDEAFEAYLKDHNSATIVEYDTNGEVSSIILGLKYRGTDIAWESLEEFDGIEDISKVTEIRDYAFEGCTSLKLTNLPDNIVKIGANSFKDCTNLKISRIPAECTEIGGHAFDNCDNIDNMIIDTKNQVIIGERAFLHCDGLVYAKVTNVKFVGPSQFGGCAKLKEIELGSKEHLVDGVNYGIFYNAGGTDLIVKIYMQRNTTYENNLKAGNEATLIIYNANGEKIN